MAKKKKKKSKKKFQQGMLLTVVILLFIAIVTMGILIFKQYNINTFIDNFIDLIKTNSKKTIEELKNKEFTYIFVE